MTKFIGREQELESLKGLIRMLACGEMVKLSRFMKQEPAEVSQLVFS
jgi:hypothetical protein